MQANLHHDPALENYMQILTKQAKFKAKVLYTLTCIQNCLSSSGPNYTANIKWLSNWQKKLAQIANIYSDGTVLELLGVLFYKFQQVGSQGACALFLDIIDKANIQGDVTNNLIESIRKMLYALRHQYNRTKSVCIKMLQKNSDKMTESQSQSILDTMLAACPVSMDQCLALSQIPTLKVNPLLILNLAWRCSYKSTENNRNKDPTQSAQYKIVTNLLKNSWHQQIVKYACLRACLWSGTNDSGAVDKLTPPFIDAFLRQNPKPFYPTFGLSQPVQKSIVLQHQNIFQHVLEYIANESQNISVLKFLLPFFQSKQQQFDILSAILVVPPISNALQQKYVSQIPITFMTCPTAIFNKLSVDSNAANVFTVITKLSSVPALDFNPSNEKGLKIYLMLLQYFVCNKKYEYLKEIQHVLTRKMKASLKQLLSLILHNNEFTLFLPCVLVRESQISSKQFQSLVRHIDSFISNQANKMEYKFYVVSVLVKMRYEQSTRKFLHYLLRNLNKNNLPYQQIAFYIKKSGDQVADGTWLHSTFEQQIQRIVQKVFAKLSDQNFKAPKDIIFTMDKHQVFEEWQPVYRWTLNPIDQPNFTNTQAIIDSFEVFQSVIQNCTHVPFQLIKKFFFIVARDWDKYNHHHMYTIERISRTLFSDQDFSQELAGDMSVYLKALAQRQWQTENCNIYKKSLTLMFRNTLMEQTDELDSSLVTDLFKQISKIDSNTVKQYQSLKIKNFAMELVMWRFQYEDTTIHQKIGEVLIKTLNIHDSLTISNQTDREMLVQNCLEIIATVGHQCNLLDLQLGKILRNYLSNKNIVSFSMEIICSIKEVNPKAVAKFQLQKVIVEILGALLLSEDEQLNKNYIQFLDELCLKGQSNYKATLVKNKQFLLQILRCEVNFVVKAYRGQIVNFIIEFLGKEDGQKLDKKWIQILWVKYYKDDKIKKWCEEDILPGLGTDKNSEIYMHEYDSINVQEIQKFLEAGDSKKTSKTKDFSKKQLKIQSEIPKRQQKEENVESKSLQSATKNKKTFNIDTQAEVQSQLSQINEKQQKQKPKKPEQDQQDQSPTAEQSSPSKQKKGGFGGFTSTKFSKNKNEQSGTKKKRAMKGGEQQKQQINNIKNNVNFIGGFEDTEANPQQVQLIKQKLHYLCDVVSLHGYYCQKAVNLGIINKCLSLGPNTLLSLTPQVLQLFQQISQNKQKNQSVFSNQKCIDFLKKNLKQSMTTKHNSELTQKVINIVQNCWNSNITFFSQGLLSMLFEMAKIDLSKQKILKLLANRQISAQIVNQIYQRGLFNVMEATFNKSVEQISDKDKVEIVYWAKIMGKVCLNHSIRQKLFTMNLHVLTFDKLQIFRQLNAVHNLAYLYAYFTYQFDKIGNWLIEKKIPEMFLQQMQQQQQKIPADYYKFMRYLSQNGKDYVEYLFRIKLHSHMILVLQSENQKITPETFKSFFKALSHLFVPEHYQKFIKNNLVSLLIAKYEQHHSFYIMECLQNLVGQIKQKRQIEVLEKQGLFTINKVFNSKIKDDMSYSYVLQIYLTLLKKFKKFNAELINHELIIKMIRKAVFSINMQGKKKTLQFVLQISEVDKICYGYSSCSRLFQSLFNYSMSYEDISMFLKYLQIQSMYPKPPRASEQARAQEQQKYPVRFKNIVDVYNPDFMEILTNKYIEIRHKLQTVKDSTQQNIQQINKMVEILCYFSKVQANAVFIFQKLSINIINKTQPFTQNFESSAKLLNVFFEITKLHKNLKASPDLILIYLKNLYEHLNSGPENQQLLQQFVLIIQNCIKYNIIELPIIQTFINDNVKSSKLMSNPAFQTFNQKYKNIKESEPITQTLKSAMKRGIKVKMYKIDGSNSTLTLHFTSDLSQINCVSSIGESVKSKWKMTLAQITSIDEEVDEGMYKKSVFYLSEGIFTKPPPMENCLILQGKQKNFYICFENPVQMKEWKKYFQLGRSNAARVWLEVNMKAKA